MKKILSLGTAAAVLSLTAVAASAALAPVVSETAVAGDQLVVEVVANEYTADIVDITIKASENLKLAEYTTTTAGMPIFNEAEMHFGWISATGAPADGEALLTLVFDVDAAAGEEVSVALVPSAGYTDGVDADAVTLTVVDGESTDIPDTTTETESSVETDTVVTTIETVTSSETQPETETKTDVPPTGIALAVVPALVAGAAVVAAKKRK